jgi:spore germination cell wall hydrolase CwlJ-like protein
MSDSRNEYSACDSTYSGDSSYNDIEYLFDIEIIDLDTTTTTQETVTDEIETTTEEEIICFIGETEAAPTPTNTTTIKTTTTTITTTTNTTTTTTKETSTTTTVTKKQSTDIGITQAEFYMLANLVAHEYGADWVATADKAKVVMTVMNRVRSDRFPNTIRGVILQRNQYCWVPDSYYWRRVTQDCKDAVTYYFTHQSEFSTNLYSFWGDGRKNHFY